VVNVKIGAFDVLKGVPSASNTLATSIGPRRSPWKKARVRAAKPWQEDNLRPAHPAYALIRIHDLKHTFGRRLRAAGVTEEDRKSLLGHKNGSITSYYSGAELGKVIEAANMVSTTNSRGPVLTILKRKIG